MAPWEKKHIIAAFSFELNMCTVDEVRNRVLNNLLVNVHPDLAAGVSANIGIAVTGTNETAAGLTATSPALSMARPSTSITGRKVAVLAVDGVNGEQISAVKSALLAQNAAVEIIANKKGAITSLEGTAIPVDKPFPNAASVLYDAVFIPGGRASIDTLKIMGVPIGFVQEAFVHGKPIAVAGEGAEILEKAAITSSDPGVTVAQADMSAFSASFIDSIKQHRFFDRNVESIPV